MRVRGQSIEAFLLAFPLALLIPVGFSYGDKGDPERYLEQFRFGCTSDYELIYCAVIELSRVFFNFDDYGTEFIISLSIIQILVGFYFLTGRVSSAIISLCIFASTSVGFLILFNLYRTSLALLVFALLFRVIKTNRFSFFISSVGSGFAHNIGFLISSFSNIIIIILGFFALLMFIAIPGSVPLVRGEDYYLLKIHEGLEDNASSFAFSGLLNVMLLYALLRKRYVHALSVLIKPSVYMCFGATIFLILGLNLVYERISAFFLFVVVAVVVKNILYRRKLFISIFVLFLAITIKTFVLI